MFTELLADIVAGRKDIADKILLPNAARPQAADERSAQRADPSDRALRQRTIPERFTHPGGRGRRTPGACSTASAGSSRQHGCDIEFVLISTEGTDRAIDVFHLTRGRCEARRTRGSSRRLQDEPAADRSLTNP